MVAACVILRSVRRRLDPRIVAWCLYDFANSSVAAIVFVTFTLLSVAGTALLATLEPGMVIRGFVLVVLTLVCYEAAVVYYNAYLPALVRAERLGSVSAI